ncbi:MAG: ASKHA domain-containing protein [bacterium]
MARIDGDVTIELLPESELRYDPGAADRDLEPQEHPGYALKSLGLSLTPLVSKANLDVPPPTLENSVDDYSRFQTSFKKQVTDKRIETPLSVLRSLASEVRQADGHLAVIYAEEADRIGVVQAVHEAKYMYGLAVDIGTTTVFVRLIDLADGKILGEASDYNAQISCGGDVIHRIVYAGKGKELAELQSLIQQTINKLIKSLLKEHKLKKDAIKIVVAAGNTTMQHLFLGLDPKQIRLEPFVPTVTRIPVVSAASSGLDVLPTAPVFHAPSVASYVGGDITAGLLAAGIHRSEKLTLYVDLGTNGEIALGNKDWLTACACSAGPAFEGAGVKCGMRAAPGGINRVESDATDGILTFQVIGHVAPRGICGSGMIDLLAELRATNRITPRGKLNQEIDPRRIRANRGKQEIVLVKGDNGTGTDDIVLTEIDIDNLIRTKGAIFAGIMTLCKGVGIQPQEIERVVIAGAFGKHLDVNNAIRIGMLPDLPRKRFEYIGNGSLQGASMALLSQRMWQQTQDIADRVTYFELSSWPGYMDEFMAALFLPHTDGRLFPSVGKINVR